MAFLSEALSIVRGSGRTGIVAVFSVILPIFGGSFLFLYGQEISNFLKQGNISSIAIFILCTAVLVGTSLLPSQAMALAGGWIFGFSLGLTYSFCGICAAALLGYLLSGKLKCEQLSELTKRYQRFDLVMHGLKNHKRGYLFSIIGLMRLSPVVPFAMTNVIMSSLKVPLKPFFIGTFFGMLPRTALMALAGAGLTELNFEQKSGYLGLSIGIAATLLALYLMSHVAKKILTTHFRSVG